MITNLDAVKGKMDSVTNYHGRSFPGKQKEQATYIGVPIIQSLSLRNSRQIREVL